MLLLCGGLVSPLGATFSNRWVSAQSGLRLRFGPGLNTRALAVIPYGARVLLWKCNTETVQIGSASGQWCRILYKGKGGWVFSAYLMRRDPTKIKPPLIRIDSPSNGWTALKVVEIKGSVENPEGLQEVKFSLNGIARFIPLKNGGFKQKIVLGSGANYVKVEASNRYGTSAASLKLVTNNARMDLKVILSWDTDRTDVDLWVTDPNRERVYYAHRRSRIGGQLDVDITTGFGPETFTLPRAIPGEYLIQAQYYGGRKPTMARVLVILYEGTAREKRMIFPALLKKSGSGTTIGRFVVD